jgi:hypothetical protein
MVFAIFTDLDIGHESHLQIGSYDNDLVSGTALKFVNTKNELSWDIETD